MESKEISHYSVPDLKLRNEINKLSQNQLDSCYQCSNCTSICPVNMVSSYNPREVIHLGQTGLKMSTADIEKLWRCTTCGACEVACPKEVKLTDIFAAYRSLAIEAEGKIPYSYTQALESFYTYGNPFNLRSEDRIGWTQGLDIPIAQKGTEVLYFVGCTASYDPRAQKIAKAVSKILKEANVNYGIVGENERECGNCVNFMGESELADHEKEKNMELIQKIQPKTIITTSPHSFNRMKHDYELPPETEVLHYSMFIDRLILEGKLSFQQSTTEKVVTYHDACYLGRHNNVYQRPRRVLNSIPGLKLVEMENNRELSICCGGGGGNVWAETKVDERLSIPRVKEALETGASTFATACYFCVSMFEDAVKVTNQEDNLVVKDIAEIVAESLVEKRTSW